MFEEIKKYIDENNRKVNTRGLKLFTTIAKNRSEYTSADINKVHIFAGRYNEDKTQVVDIVNGMIYQVNKNENPRQSPYVVRNNEKYVETSIHSEIYNNNLMYVEPAFSSADRVDMLKTPFQFKNTYNYYVTKRRGRVTKFGVIKKMLGEMNSSINKSIKQIVKNNNRVAVKKLKETERTNRKLNRQNNKINSNNDYTK